MKRKLLFLFAFILMLFMCLMSFDAFASTGTDMMIQVNTTVTENLGSWDEQDIFRFRLDQPGSLQAVRLQNIYLES